MRFHRDNDDGINTIRAFGADGIRVGQHTLTPPCVVGVSTIIEHWDAGDIDGLTTDQLAPVFELQPEVILLGSGPTLKFPNIEVIQAVNRNGIGFEVMDNAAGCRTYNVLAHEGRDIALALLAPIRTPR